MVHQYLNAVQAQITWVTKRMHFSCFFKGLQIIARYCGLRKGLSWRIVVSWDDNYIDVVRNLLDELGRKLVLFVDVLYCEFLRLPGIYTYSVDDVSSYQNILHVTSNLSHLLIAVFAVEP